MMSAAVAGPTTPVRPTPSYTTLRDVTLGYVQQSGSAWDKAQAAADEHGYPVPRWEEFGYVIRATIPIHPQAAVGGSETSEKRRAATTQTRTREDRRPEIMTFLVDGEKSPAQIAAHIGISARHTRRLLTEMVREGLVEDNGEPAKSPKRRYRHARPAQSN